MSQNEEAAIEAVRQKLQSICKFMESNRGGGNTTASVAGLRAIGGNGMLVMQDRLQERRASKTHGGNGVRVGTLDDLLADRTGTDRKAFPVIFDGDFVYNLCKDAATALEDAMALVAEAEVS